jgi:hypothetical protein
MKLITSSRYASVTATLALVLAMGGTSYAVTKIDANSVKSKQIKNGAVKAKDLKNGAVTNSKLGTNAVTSAKVADDSLTGADINESTLGTVPGADKVNGQKVVKVRYSSSSEADQTIFDSNGLRITANCAGGNPEVTARTSKADSSIYTLVGQDLDPTYEVLQDDLESGTFSTSEEFDLLAGGNGNINQLYFGYDAPDGTVGTGILTVDVAGPCVVAGHVTIG